MKRMILNNFIKKGTAMGLLFALCLNSAVVPSFAALPGTEATKSEIRKEASLFHGTTVKLQLDEIDFRSAVTKAIHKGSWPSLTEAPADLIEASSETDLEETSFGETGTAVGKLLKGEHSLYELNIFSEEQKDKLEKEGLRIHALVLPEGDSGITDVRNALYIPEESPLGELYTAFQETALSQPMAEAEKKPDYEISGDEEIIFLVENTAGSRRKLELSRNGQKLGEELEIISRDKAVEQLLSHWKGLLKEETAEETRKEAAESGKAEKEKAAKEEAGTTAAERAETETATKSTIEVPEKGSSAAKSIRAEKTVEEDTEADRTETDTAGRKAVDEETVEAANTDAVSADSETDQSESINADISGKTAVTERNEANETDAEISDEKISDAEKPSAEATEAKTQKATDSTVSALTEQDRALCEERQSLLKKYSSKELKQDVVSVGLMACRLSDLDGVFFTAEVDGYQVSVQGNSDSFSEPVRLKVQSLYWPEDEAQETKGLPKLWNQVKAFFGAEGEQEERELNERERRALEKEGLTREETANLDIRFVNEDGEEVEPKGEVKVRIQMDAGLLREKQADPTALKVLHLKEEGDILSPETVADSTREAVTEEIRTGTEAISGEKNAEETDNEIKGVTDSGISKEINRGINRDTGSETKTGKISGIIKAVKSEEEVSLAEVTEPAEDNAAKEAANDETADADIVEMDGGRVAGVSRLMQDGEAVEGSISHQGKRLSEAADAVVAEFKVDSFSMFTIAWRNGDGRLGLISFKAMTERRDGTLAELTEAEAKTGWKDRELWTGGSIVLNTKDRAFNSDYMVLDNDYSYSYAFLENDPEKRPIQSITASDEGYWAYRWVLVRRIRYWIPRYTLTVRFINGEEQKYSPNSYSSPELSVIAVYTGKNTNHPEEIETVDTIDRGVSINLYNYVDDAENEYTAEINSGHSFQFNRGGGKGINQYRAGGDSSALCQGIVENNLGSDGNPVLKSNGKSLGYLFPASEGKGVTEVMEDMNHLFYEKDGYLEYDSSKYFATVDDGKALDNYLLPEDKDFRVYNRASSPAFAPFSDIDAGGTVFNRNLWFGMTVETRFLQPKAGKVSMQKDGKTTSSPMRFEFSGDDDVWVFIDGKLVLDLGGIHGTVDGSIDFSTGEIKEAGKVKAGKLGDILKGVSEISGTTLKDYSTHTMKIFYFERGENLSNCKIRFNLQTIPKGSIYFGKNVTLQSEDNGIDLSRSRLPEQYFRFRLELAEGQGGSFIPYQSYREGDFRLFEGEIGDDAHSREISPGTEEYSRAFRDGVFYLKSGQYIKLSAFNGKELTATDCYRVSELGDPSEIGSETGSREGAGSANGESTFSDFYTVKAFGQTLTPAEQNGISIYTAEPKTVGEDPILLFENETDLNRLDRLVIGKELEGIENTEEQSYRIKVTLRNEPYCGSYAVFDTESTDLSPENGTVETTEDGSILLKAGQRAVLYGIFWGMPFTVKEDTSSLDTSYSAPTYQLSGTPETESTVEKDLKGEELVSGIMPVKTGGSISITVINHKKSVPPTGVRKEVYPFLLLFLLGILGSGAFFRTRRSQLDNSFEG